MLADLRKINATAEAKLTSVEAFASGTASTEVRNNNDYIYYAYHSQLD